MGPTGPNKDALVGTWLSTGADVAKGFGGAPFKFAELEATFNADGSYTVIATDTSGKKLNFAGTWQATTSASTGVFEITQNQAMPQSVVSKGIYTIDEMSGKMTFELIQVQPDVGATAPTAMGGFGSTTVKGTKTDAWIQKYVRK
jgi:hypothetical protein